MQIFISYSRADKDFAAQLLEDLSDYDVKIWMDVRNIPHGANWDLEVQKGLDSSDMLLLLLSPTAVQSQNVTDEWSYFIAKNKPILPLLIQPCDVPFRLMRRQQVDFTTDYFRGLQELINALGAPRLIDPESTQKVRNPLSPTTPLPQTGRLVEKPQTGMLIEKSVPQAAPRVEVKTFPVFWATSYHWFGGMTGNLTAGELRLNGQEMLLVPSDQPLISIPLKNLLTAHLQRSIDQYVALTYTTPSGNQQSLVLMGAPKNRRQVINADLISTLKRHTGRSLE